LGFGNPKVFFDFATKKLDFVVTPMPFLQLANLVCGLVVLLWEWPLVDKFAVHASFHIRFAALPAAAFVSIFLYQATNPALYYLIGLALYTSAYRNGEVGGTRASGMVSKIDRSYNPTPGPQPRPPNHEPRPTRRM
jgi:hypothetical protein